MRDTATQEATMTEPAPYAADLQEPLERVLAELARLAKRVAELEANAPPAPGIADLQPAVAATAPVPQISESNVAVAEAAGITEEELLAISAALAAWLGVHHHIRQIRLIRTSAWAQQGRVTIQASHGLYH